MTMFAIQNYSLTQNFLNIHNNINIQVRKPLISTKIEDLKEITPIVISSASYFEKFSCST